MPSKARWASMTEEQKETYKLQHRNWVAKNRERNREYQRKAYLRVVGELTRQSPLTSNPEITKEKKRTSVYNWQKRNPDKVQETYLRQKEKGHISAKAAKRRAAKRNATPLWADLDCIKDVYKEAKYFGYHVDHIIPLQHDLVCGLHVWDNLQLLRPTDNIRKKNTYAIYEETC